ATFPAETIAIHIQLASGLSEERPAQFRIAYGDSGEFEIAIVGFDYLGQFSIFCGLLSAFGLDIRTGDIFSFSERTSSSRVVDVFRVALRSGGKFDDLKEAEFEDELHTLARLLGEGSAQE